MGRSGAGSTGAILVGSIALLTIVALRHALLDEQRVTRLESQNLEIRSPGPAVLSAVTIEHRLAAADVTWLSVVQELGKSTRLSDADWSRVERWGRLAVDLDRLYFTVYHSVAVNLSVLGQRVAASDELLQLGMSHLPTRWELPFVLGYNAYFVRGDAILASNHIEAAAGLPGSPAFLPSLAGRMRFHGGDELGALQLIETMTAGLEGRALDEAIERGKLLRSELRLRTYDAACRSHRAEHGALPSPVELYQQGLVQMPAEDLFGEPITFDDDCVARTKMTNVREFEAQRRVGSAAGTSTTSLIP